MRQTTRAALLAAAVGAACTATSPAHAATSVAYLDGNEIWVANTDGSSKTRLSGGEGDWRAVSQNAQGWIIGVQNEAGKISDLSRFTLWNAKGAVAAQGPLNRDYAGPSYAYPLGLEVTSTGGNHLYGFSALTFFFGGTSLRTGYFLSIPTAAALQPTPFAGSTARSGYPTHFSLVDDRIVGAVTASVIGIQEAGNLGNATYTPWPLGTLPNGYEFRGSDVSADGKIVTTELAEDLPGEGLDLIRIAVAKTEGLGGAYVDDCILDLPVDSTTGHPTVAPDGSVVAWEQVGGVKVTGAPNLRVGGPATCELTTGVTTISPTGSYPSLGGFDLAAYLASKTPPATGGGGTGAAGPGSTGTGSTGGAANPAPALVVKLGKAPKLSTGSSSQSLKITPQATGTANVTITIDPKRVGQKGKTPISLATGSQKVTAGKQATVKLKPSKKAKSLKKKLKGKKATITITVGTAVYTGTIKLG